MKKIIKSNIIVCILLMLVSVGGVAAATVYFGSDIGYDNSKTKLKSGNIQDAIDEVYDDLVSENTCIIAAEPVIKEGLVPVKIADDGKVKMVSENDPNWYNYCKKQWANAVILVSGKSYNVGDTIPEEAIESYLVWIPKYKYKLWNVGVTDTETLAHSIDIVFDTTNTTDTSTSCATPMTSGGTGNCANGKYMTHPAFISMGVNGFWVGKFELTGSIDNLTVKPNQVSLKEKSVSEFFTAMKNYKKDIYPHLNSHMMKNTEWGAVAYLSHSKYGINKEVNINNNSNFKTGYSALLTTQQGTRPGESGDGASYNKAYNTDVGYLASTTGNISGIYDMSGGSHEYMASYRSGASKPSGEAKYFDEYNANSTETSYQYRILGDATGEMGPFVNYKDGDGITKWHNKWYGDRSYFIDSTNTWFYRGGVHSHGGIDSQFEFFKYTGEAYFYVGSRLVLAP